MSRIEQLIDEIEEFVESCKPQPFFSDKDCCSEGRAL